METALGYLYQIFDGFINMVFNDFEIVSGVTIGWVMLSVIVFGILLNSILNIPKGVQFSGRQSHNRNN